jgi:hypothetical protein
MVHVFARLAAQRAWRASRRVVLSVPFCARIQLAETFRKSADWGPLAETKYGKDCRSRVGLESIDPGAMEHALRLAAQLATARPQARTGTSAA